MMFSPVVITPTYQNGRTLGDVIRRIKAQELPLIVVDDGSTDQTPDVIAAARLQFHKDTPLLAMTHDRNQGKAAALRTGFKAAIQCGYTHAITIDTDGQHDPEQVPMLLAAVRRQPSALVIGVRNERIEGYPVRSLLGRRISNLLVWIESGVRVHDSQCGLRVYPLELIQAVPCRTDHFNFETEIITRVAWAGWPITEVPAHSRYLPPDERVSHFRPYMDTLRAIGMHLDLIMRSVWYWTLRLFKLRVAREMDRVGV